TRWPLPHPPAGRLRDGLQEGAAAAIVEPTSAARITIDAASPAQTHHGGRGAHRGRRSGAGVDPWRSVPPAIAEVKAGTVAGLPKAAQGTFDQLLAEVEPDLAAIARRLRAIIRAVDPTTVETVRLG